MSITSLFYGGGCFVRLTVYFDGQFWIGVTEFEESSKMKACRYIFGKEPKDAEILDFVRHMMIPLLDRVSAAAEVGERQERRINPKRMARLAAKEVQNRGISTQAQEALRLELEGRKKARKSLSRQQREEMKERKRALKIQRAKQKHRGR